MRSREHRRWRLAAEAYADGELPRWLVEPLRAHLSECWDCSEDVELVRMLKASLCRQPARLAPLELARLRRRVDNVGGRPVGATPARRRDDL